MMIEGQTVSDVQLDYWADLAKRDDALDRFVPSDIRQIIGDLQRARAALAKAQANV